MLSLDTQHSFKNFFRGGGEGSHALKVEERGISRL